MFHLHKHFFHLRQSDHKHWSDKSHLTCWCYSKIDVQLGSEQFTKEIGDLHAERANFGLWWVYLRLWRHQTGEDIWSITFTEHFEDKDWYQEWKYATVEILCLPKLNYAVFNYNFYSRLLGSLFNNWFFENIKRMLINDATPSICHDAEVTDT